MLHYLVKVELLIMHSAALLSKCISGSNQDSRGQTFEMKDESPTEPAFLSLSVHTGSSLYKYTPCLSTHLVVMILYKGPQTDHLILHSEKPFLHSSVGEIVRKVES